MGKDALVWLCVVHWAAWGVCVRVCVRWWGVVEWGVRDTGARDTAKTSRSDVPRLEHAAGCTRRSGARGIVNACTASNMALS